MSKKKKRVDVNTEPESLTHNPFAELADKFPDNVPEQKTGRHEQEPLDEHESPRNLPYRIGRTRKGGYDIVFERRAKGKGVTVIRRVQGDAKALLKVFKKKCGAGGTVHADTIELQGDHRAVVEGMIRDMGL